MRLFNKKTNNETKVTPPERVITLETPFGCKTLTQVGAPTVYKDYNGLTLHIGDLVLITSTDNQCYPCQLSLVVKDEKKSFIMGIENACDESSGEITNWKIERLKPYYEVESNRRCGHCFIKEV